MSDSLVHLKLDKVLAGLDAVVTEQAEQRSTIAALTQSIGNLDNTLNTLIEVVSQLAQAVSSEQAAEGGEMKELIARIAVRLDEIKADGTRMVTTIFRLPDELSRAAHDAVRMALRDGVAIPSPGRAPP